MAGVVWVLAGIIGFAGSGYWEKRMEANSFLDRGEWERLKDDYDEETHCHLGCDLEFVAAALAIAVGACMIVYSRFAPGLARAKVPSSDTKPDTAMTPPTADVEV